MSSLLAFGAALGAQLLGIVLGTTVRRSVPATHLHGDAKDVVKLATGLTATMTALVLGLFLSSASTTFNAQYSNVASLAAYVARLDLVLDHIGPEAAPIREELRRAVPAVVARIWSPLGTSVPLHVSREAATIFDGISRLSAATPVQAQLKGDAANAYEAIIGVVLTIDTRNDQPLQWPFFVLLTFWLTTIFTTFSLCVDLNGTVRAALVLCAVSVASSLYLIYELGQPFEGLLMVSPEKLLSVLGPL